MAEHTLFETARAVKRPHFIGNGNPNWHGGDVRINCLTCGGEFYVIPSRASKAKFCSMKCIGRWQHLYPHVKLKPRVKRNCRECGTTFEILPSHVTRKFFCSESCQGKWRSKTFVGPKGTNWRGGLSKERYPGNWQTVSRRVIRRDGGTCQNPECDGTSERITAHHIDHVKKNCAHWNLIALCAACNSRAGADREASALKYYAIMAARGIGM